LNSSFLNDNTITEERVIQRLSRHQGAAAVEKDGRQVRQAAVLVPICRVDGKWHLLYTRRTDTVLTHKGQVAFPGGAVEADDPDVTYTALREAYEEIGLIPDQVKILGRMPNYVTISDYLITPIVGRVPWPFELVLSAGEVMSVFTIPLDWLTDPTNWQEKPFTRPDGRQEMVIFYETYLGELLWGITARITLNFLDILGLR
jgi:8-oxo-dGTP pyrophosphatase MutT (NUDIX family)